MNLLFDSHAFLWWITDDARFPTTLRRSLVSGSSAAWVSVASIWELEMKRANGKLTVDTDLVEEAAAAGFEGLPITFEHGVAAAWLPAHHRDPFDRMLVAQARLEGLTLVSRDPHIRRYDVPTLWD